MKALGLLGCVFLMLLTAGCATPSSTKKRLPPPRSGAADSRSTAPVPVAKPDSPKTESGTPATGAVFTGMPATVPTQTATLPAAPSTVPAGSSTTPTPEPPKTEAPATAAAPATTPPPKTEPADTGVVAPGVAEGQYDNERVAGKFIREWIHKLSSTNKWEVEEAMDALELAAQGGRKAGNALPKIEELMKKHPDPAIRNKASTLYHAVKP
jgi:hypothetical protein